MLLLVIASPGILVPEDKVDLRSISAGVLGYMDHTAYLVRGAALVRTKHDDVRRCVREFLGVKSLVILKKLQVRSTTFETVYCIC